MRLVLCLFTLSLCICIMYIYMCVYVNEYIAFVLFGSAQKGGCIVFVEPLLTINHPPPFQPQSDDSDGEGGRISPRQKLALSKARQRGILNYEFEDMHGRPINLTRVSV
jgi:hypothetical protein